VPQDYHHAAIFFNRAGSRIGARNILKPRKEKFRWHGYQSQYDAPFYLLNHSSGSLEPFEKSLPAFAVKRSSTERPKAATPLTTVQGIGVDCWIGFFPYIRFLNNKKIIACTKMNSFKAA
jgi:hypothetical protein